MTQTIRDFYNPLLPTLFMAIHKEPVAEIKSGLKVIEYRKSFFKEAFQAFVYTAGKDGGIELFLQFAPAITADNITLAKVGSQIQHDDYQEIVDYFSAKQSGCLLPILTVTECAKQDLPTLKTSLPTVTVPQKYSFLDRPDKQPLLEFLLTQSVTKRFTNDWEHYFQQIAACFAATNESPS